MRTIKTEHPNHTNKVVMLTGAGGTLGKAVALELARRGAKLRLIYSPRITKEAMDADIKKLKMATGNTDIKAYRVDFSSLKSINDMVSEYTRTTEEPLHALINNAGVFCTKKRLEDENGNELTLSINFLGPYALTLLLIERLRQAEKSRIINVTSEDYTSITNFEKFYSDYNAEKNFSIRQYSFSKLALIHFTLVLAKKLEGSGITVNAMHPGAVPGNMWKGLPLLLQLRMWRHLLLAPILAPGALLKPAEACGAYMQLCFSQELEGVSGRYFYLEEEYPLNDLALNKEYAKLSWELGARLTGLDLQSTNVTHKAHRTSTAYVPIE